MESTLLAHTGDIFHINAKSIYYFYNSITTSAGMTIV